MPSKKQMAELQQKMDAMEAGLNDEIKNLKQKAETQIQNLTAGLQTEKGLRANVEQSLQSSMDEVGQLKTEKGELTANVGSLQENVATLEKVQSEYEALQVKVQEQEALVGEKSKGEESLNAAIKDLKDSLEKSESGKAELEGQVKSLTLAQTTLADTIAGFKEKLEAAGGEIDNFKYQVESLEETLSDRQTLCEDLTAQLDEVSKGRGQFDMYIMYYLYILYIVHYHAFTDVFHFMELLRL
jgi:chromosome segregation ATPase